MGRIQQLPLDTTITGGDKLVGTDVGSNNASKSYQIETIAAFFAEPVMGGGGVICTNRWCGSS